MRSLPALVLAFCFFGWGATAVEPSAFANLPRSTPEQQGVSSAAILRFIEATPKLDELHSFMLVRHGHVIAEGWWAPYAPNEQHVLLSLSAAGRRTECGVRRAQAAAADRPGRVGQASRASAFTQ